MIMKEAEVFNIAKSIRSIKAAICAFVHHRGWCKSFHAEQEPYYPSWSTGCPFKDVALIALYPPIVIGDLKNISLDDQIMKELSERRPGLIVKGE